MNYGILMHDARDDVGVAVMDLESGDKIGAATLDGVQVGSIQINEDIPLGHKVAIQDISNGQNIIEYGDVIGKATQQIGQGSHVHTHNLATLRWQQ